MTDPKVAETARRCLPRLSHMPELFSVMYEFYPGLVLPGSISWVTPTVKVDICKYCKRIAHGQECETCGGPQ